MLDSKVREVSHLEILIVEIQVWNTQMTIL